ncbi:DUF6168 family protein [Polaribacter butkevichii]|uniref:Uncharacterized protein n=1 Tax=Polaribacter butkevichii TaxID=218490 RepID=A0A2P6C7K8_9FLAO|nr:DUF6168 family protein [Polaribacter butkevichii]PQJ68895.1 hypothetical protein BTO14_12680 [Polaribacter butkevichii]
MIKSILVFSIVFFTLFLLSFTIHSYFIEEQTITLPYSLKKVYLFHYAFSLLICTNFLFFSRIPKIFEQLGFIYLGTILLKLTLFSILFYTSLFSENELTFSERLSLFIPAIVFLLIEALFVAKILKKK